MENNIEKDFHKKLDDDLFEITVLQENTTQHAVADITVPCGAGCNCSNNDNPQ
ncbi:hypothetical protein [Spartinivicinus poritis]|uniref:Uncharacterized protein n=1 Tax=Spartinivicinus poritis TaxID=2994640 RepID=A0ABT5UH72_9GAMM|nr:hypothetical protein [Spartinivicinus sp. A2-2]MDE1464847.1 hypothetical protein [Spartinivicinus sp. A2-2]